MKITIDSGCSSSDVIQFCGSEKYANSVRFAGMLFLNQGIQSDK